VINFFFIDFSDPQQKHSAFFFLSISEKIGVKNSQVIYLHKVFVPNHRFSAQ